MGTIGKITDGSGATHLLASTAYGTCPTAAATVAKVATIQGEHAFTLFTGITVHIKFTYANTVANPTLNVNSTGAKPIVKYGTTAAGKTVHDSWSAGAIVSFTYDGTSWVMNDHITNTTTNDTGYYILTNGFRLTAGTTYKIWRYSLFARTSDGTYESFTNTSGTAATKTKNPHGFLPDGKIYWNSASATDYSGVTNFSAYEQYYSVDYRYTFNIGTTGLPASANTYLKWTYNTNDGLLYLADEWLATALPSTADNFIYQRIGSNYYGSADYRGSLLLNNPYYAYDNGIKVWYPVASTTVAGVVKIGTGVTNAAAGNHTHAYVSTVAWDSTNNKLTKTISGTTTDVVTAATLRSAMGLSNALHFRGVSTGNMADATTNDEDISGVATSTLQAGDVVLDKGNEYEFIWTGEKWERLGGDSSYALLNHTHNVLNAAPSGTGVTAYYPLFSASAAGSDAIALAPLTNASIRYGIISGTTSTIGESRLLLGNGTNSGSNGNQKGFIYLYGQTGDDAHVIQGANTTDKRTHTFQDASGTIAHTDDITTAINALDVSNISGFGAGKTLSALSEANGKISATFQDISITQSQISDFSHSHGNITNGGTITSTGVAIANGDMLLISDSSGSGKVERTSITFDGSTATKALTQKGTWETFNNYSHPTTDGNLHVPATGTTNGGKFLKAGSTAKSISWASITLSDVSGAAISWDSTEKSINQNSAVVVSQANLQSAIFYVGTSAPSDTDVIWLKPVS